MHHFAVIYLRLHALYSSNWRGSGTWPPRKRLANSLCLRVTVPTSCNHGVASWFQSLDRAVRSPETISRIKGAAAAAAASGAGRPLRCQPPPPPLPPQPSAASAAPAASSDASRPRRRFRQRRNLGWRVAAAWRRPRRRTCAGCPATPTRRAGPPGRRRPAAGRGVPRLLGACSTP